MIRPWAFALAALGAAGLAGCGPMPPASRSPATQPASATQTAPGAEAPAAEAPGSSPATQPAAPAVALAEPPAAPAATQTSLDLLIEVLRHDDDAAARAGAAQGLARLRRNESVPALFEALGDPDAKVRVWAITAIAKISLLHFRYDAAVPPEQQRSEIRHIEQYLQKINLL